MTWQIPNRRLIVIAMVTLVLDQLSKFLVVTFLPPDKEVIVIDGFFKFVRWGNKGAAWSLFGDSNFLLAIISLVALAALIVWHKHFDTHTLAGQISLGLITGGIAGNLFDRLNPHRFQVIDFFRFYLYRHNGEEIGYPAFNIADSAICVGVAMLVILSWRQSERPPNA